MERVSKRTVTETIVLDEADIREIVLKHLRLNREGRKNTVEFRCVDEPVEDGCTTIVVTTER